MPKKPKAPTAAGLRPVSARALKSAQDTLRPHLFKARVLDLFCGLGRFGLAALKESASEAVFVDKNQKVLDHIRLEADKNNYRAKYLRADCLAYLRKQPLASRRYDIVFADPPFAAWDKAFVEELITAVSAVVSSGSIFLVKRPSRMIASLAISGFSLWKETKFGESTLTYLEYGSEG